MFLQMFVSVEVARDASILSEQGKFKMEQFGWRTLYYHYDHHQLFLEQRITYE